MQLTIKALFLATAGPASVFAKQDTTFVSTIRALKEARKLQFDDFIASDDGTAFLEGFTDELINNITSGLFAGMNMTGGTQDFGSGFNDVFNATFSPNGTLPPGFEDMLAGLMNNITNVMGDLMNNITGVLTEGLMGGFDNLFNATFSPNNTLPPGFEDMMGDLTNNITGVLTEGLVGGSLMGFENMTMGELGCPDTCPAEICASMSEDNSTEPDEKVVMDVCNAGTLKSCFMGMGFTLLCDMICADETNSAFMDDAEDVCSLCKFADCCDGENTYEMCKHLVPSDTTETGSTLTPDTLPETATDASTEDEVNNTNAEDGNTEDSGEDVEGGNIEEHDDHDEGDHAHTENFSNTAGAHFIATATSVVSIGMLLAVI